MTTSSTPASPTTREPPVLSYRLPTTTQPIRYEVSLTPYFENAVRPFSFDGEVTIYLRAKEEDVSQIVMHCNDLNILTLQVTLLDGTPVTLQDTDVYTCDDYDFLKINTINPLELDQEYKVYITFIGRLQNNMRGFYRSWYVDSTKKKR